MPTDFDVSFALLTRRATRSGLLRLLGPLLVAAGACHMQRASAQEFALFGGALTGTGTHTYSWAFDYQEGLGKYAALGITWLNEGHLPAHHRDGPSVQLWGRLPLENRRFVLSAGVGPYRYSDTTNGGPDGFMNDHGVGALMSVRAAYYTSDRWIMQVQLNRVQISGGPNTTGVLFGIGYQLDAPDEPGPRDRPLARTDRVTGNEFTVLAGETIKNSLNSESGFSTSVEYRRGLFKYVDWTASYMHENVPAAVRRNGLASQLWLTRAFFNEHLTLAAGVGPYYAIDTFNGPGSAGIKGTISGLISLSASYRLSKHWLTRVTWNRVVTRTSLDADLIQAGIGYRF
ncbi:hypothetical protein LMG29739_01122 [Paraburkholderia solisilvae]|uniref:Uncharacterized protein n=2 Tax=Paraburkholderia solisilvae TaxID=624376 RepID=A0A6J5DCI1_9BURK|nr:hypothetical protein LMG29739_01122 [Paraburkholderia solisilvae]